MSLRVNTSVMFLESIDFQSASVIQDLIKDKKVVLEVQSKQAKKKRVKVTSKNKICKGKIAKELKKKLSVNSTRSRS